MRSSRLLLSLIILNFAGTGVNLRMWPWAEAMNSEPETSPISPLVFIDDTTL